VIAGAVAVAVAVAVTVTITAAVYVLQIRDTSEAVEGEAGGGRARVVWRALRRRHK